MSNFYACDTCARADGRMRGSALHRCYDVRFDVDDAGGVSMSVPKTKYAALERPVAGDGQSMHDACHGWVSADAVGE